MRGTELCLTQKDFISFCGIFVSQLIVLTFLLKIKILYELYSYFQIFILPSNFKSLLLIRMLISKIKEPKSSESL